MKILVTGSNGLLGQKLAAYAPGHAEVWGVDLQEKSFSAVLRYQPADLGDVAVVAELVRRIEPQWINRSTQIGHIVLPEIRVFLQPVA